MSVWDNKPSGELYIKAVRNAFITRSLFVRTKIGIVRACLFETTSPATIRKWNAMSFLSIVKNKLRFWKDENYYFIFNIWGTGYHHWLTEVVVKLAYFDKEIRQSVIVVPESFPPFVKEFLELAGFDNLKVMQGNSYVRRINVVSNPSSGHYNAAHLAKLREYIFSFIPDTNTSFEKIYISRRGSRARKIVNEDLLIPILEAHGYTCVELDTMSFKEQVNLFRHCKSIASIHGAGLTNALFMPEGGEMIEIFPQYYEDNDMRACYFRMAGVLKLRHQFLFAPREFPDRKPDMHNGNIRVDLEILKQLLETKEQQKPLTGAAFNPVNAKKEMATILIYYPYKERSVEQQSVMEMLLKKGHKVILLTLSERGYIHEFMEKLGGVAHAIPPVGGKLRTYYNNIRNLDTFVKRYKVDVVIAQQQVPALVAGFLRKLRRFKLVYFRHNTDESYRDHPVRVKWLNKLANAVTPVKVAPSSVVKSFWMNKEAVSEKEIVRVNYGYNFDQYEKPVAAEVARIRAMYPCKLLVMSMARLMPMKRHSEMFDVIGHFINQGIDIKMICLGSGPLDKSLEEEIQKEGYAEHIFLVGQQKNIFNFIEAADVFMHLSLSEASNSSVKEVGLCAKPVIVCAGVGDFSDYITDGVTGFLASKDNPVPDAIAAIEKMLADENYRRQVGERFRDLVQQKFSIDNVSGDYDQLLERVNAR